MASHVPAARKCVQSIQTVAALYSGLSFALLLFSFFFSSCLVRVVLFVMIESVSSENGGLQDKVSGSASLLWGLLVDLEVVSSSPGRPFYFFKFFFSFGLTRPAPAPQVQCNGGMLWCAFSPYKCKKVALNYLLGEASLRLTQQGMMEIKGQQRWPRKMLELISKNHNSLSNGSFCLLQPLIFNNNSRKVLAPQFIISKSPPPRLAVSQGQAKSLILSTFQIPFN